MRFNFTNHIAIFTVMKNNFKPFGPGWKILSYLCFGAGIFLNYLQVLVIVTKLLLIKVSDSENLEFV